MINIYVSNLSSNTTEKELQALFETYGEVSSAKIILDKFTGKSRGFGFIEMPDKAAGEEAINALNGQDLNGKTLKVNEARPRTERRNFGNRSGGNGGGGYNRSRNRY